MTKGIQGELKGALTVFAMLCLLPEIWAHALYSVHSMSKCTMNPVQ